MSITEGKMCPLCGKINTGVIFTDNGYDLLACCQCGMLYIAPYPNNQHERVKDYSYSHLQIADEVLHYSAETIQYKDKFSAICDLLEGARSILDVGCGSGRLLELLKERFPDIHLVGIELNHKRAEEARKNSQCEIINVPVEEIVTTQSFDAIVMNNVLSHIHNLDSLFINLKRIMNSKGKLIIVAGEHSHDIRKSDIFDWSIPDHLHFLGLQTIDYICSKYGFKILLRKRVPYSKELFSKTFFLTPGRSPIRNRIKYAIAHVPFLLSVLSFLYDMLKGKRIYTSTIVLQAP